MKASPALLDVLRAQIETVTLEAQAAGWDDERRLLMFPTPEGGFARDGHFASV